MVLARVGWGGTGPCEHAGEGVANHRRVHRGGPSDMDVGGVTAVGRGAEKDRAAGAGRYSWGRKGRGAREWGCN